MSSRFSTIFGTFGGITGSSVLEVMSIPTSIVLSAPATSITAASTQQFTAIAHYADNSTEDVSNLATWNTTNGIASVDQAGLVTAGGTVGSTVVRATFAGVTGTFNLDVVPANVGDMTTDMNSDFA